jgi:hypothetical protein
MAYPCTIVAETFKREVPSVGASARKRTPGVRLITILRRASFILAIFAASSVHADQLDKDQLLSKYKKKFIVAIADGIAAGYCPTLQIWTSAPIIEIKSIGDVKVKAAPFSTSEYATEPIRKGEVLQVSRAGFASGHSSWRDAPPEHVRRVSMEAPALRRCRRTPKVKSQHRHPDVDRSARSRRPDCRKQFFLHDPEVDHLIPRNVGDDDTDLKLGMVLLKFDAPIDCYENVKLLLRRRQEISVFQRVPALLVNGRGSVFANEQLNARIYALVNEDANSRSWLLAKSSTARTCPRLMEG